MIYKKLKLLLASVSENFLIIQFKSTDEIYFSLFGVDQLHFFVISQFHYIRTLSNGTVE